MLLNELCSVNAVSGNEFEMTRFMQKKLNEISICSETDSLGNLIVSSKDTKPVTVMLEAHMDQVGLVVREIDCKGFVKFTKAGGVDFSILPACEVIIHGKEDIYGVIGALPPHLQIKGDENKKSLDDMYIDCGIDYDTASSLIKIGDTISFVSPLSELKNGYISGKSLDNRVGVYVITECLKRLRGKDLPCNITALYSVREEVGGTGAKSAVAKINPDVAIVVDVTFGDSPYTTEEDSFGTCNGITVCVGANVDRVLSQRFIDSCKNNNIGVEKEVCGRSTGTDAWPIQVSGKGVRCVVVSVPIRYMHTTVETVNITDIESAIESICKAIEGGVFNA